MPPAACGSSRCVLRSSWPGALPGVPQDSRYLPSGAKIQYWFANESATQMSRVFGSIAGHHVWQQGVGCVGPLFSQRSFRPANGDGVGTGADALARDVPVLWSPAPKRPPRPMITAVAAIASATPPTPAAMSARWVVGHRREIGIGAALASATST